MSVLTDWVQSLTDLTRYQKDTTRFQGVPWFQPVFLALDIGSDNVLLGPLTGIDPRWSMH